jgi:hypothetical protein
VNHEQIVARLHAAHLTHQGDDPEIVEDCAVCAMYAEWVAPLIAEAEEQARAAGVVEQMDRNSAAVTQAERRVRQVVWDYCEVSGQIAEENDTNPFAVGLARGYRDVQNKLAPALGEVR